QYVFSPLGVSNLVSDLTDMLNGTPLSGGDWGVEAGPSIKAGRSLLRENRLPPRIRPCSAKGSAAGGYAGGLGGLTKASATGTARQILQEDRFVFDDRMAPEALATTPSAQTIYQALLTYPYNKTPDANDAFASREGAYDDLILAVALACWFGEHCRREFSIW